MRWEVYAEQGVQEYRGAGCVEATVRGPEGRERGRDRVLNREGGARVAGFICRRFGITFYLTLLHPTIITQGRLYLRSWELLRRMPKVDVGIMERVVDRQRPTYTGTLQHGKPSL